MNPEQKELWQFGKMGERTLYQLFFQGPDCTLAVSDGKGNQAVLGAAPFREVYQLGDWLAEAHRLEKNAMLEVLLQRQKGDGGQVTLSVRKGSTNVYIRLLRKTKEERTFPQVVRLTVGAEQIQAVRKAPEAPPPPKEPPQAPEKPPQAPKKEPPSPKPAGPQKAPQGAEEARRKEEAGRKPAEAGGPPKGGARSPSGGGQRELEVVKAAQEAQAARKEAQAAKAQAQALEQTVAQLRTQLGEAQKRSAGLETAAAAQLEEALKTLGPIREQLGAALTAALEEAQAAEASLQAVRDQTAEARTRTEAAERELAALREELEGLNRLETLRSLDCGQVQKELRGLRAQLEADGYTLELLRVEPFLKEKPIQEQLSEIRTRLEQAESWLGQAVLRREQINSRVQKTILSQDGALPLAEELGGAQHGRRGTETEDS